MYDVSLLMKANSRIQKRRPILQDGHFIFVSDEPFFDEYALAEFMAFCNRIVHGGYPKGIPVIVQFTKEIKFEEKLISEVGVLTGTDDLIECLNSMRKDFLYFQYADTPFFDGLKDKLQGLEDYLILAEEHPLAEEKAMSFLHHVDSSLSHIYEDVVAHF